MADPSININVNANTTQAQRAFSQLRETFTGIKGKLLEVGVTALEFGSIMSVGANIAIDALTSVYKAAREGADSIGGATAAAYDRLDSSWEELSNTGKEFLATVLLPTVTALGEVTDAMNQVNEANERGKVTDGERALAFAKLISFNSLLSKKHRDQVIEDLAEIDASIDGTIEHYGNLSKAMLANVNFANSSWDAAMLVSAGLIESKVNPALEAQKREMAENAEAVKMLGYLMSGPVSKQMQSFADQEQALIDKQADLREKITALGGLDYITPEQQAQILDLRKELIGTVIEINNIEEAFGDAFEEGKTGQKVMDARERMEELRSKAWELEQQIIALGSKPYTTPGQLESIAELQEQLGEVDQAFGDLAAASEDAARRMIFSMIEANFAVGGFTDEEVRALMKLGETWGLIDEATAEATTSILEATSQFEEDEDFFGLMTAANNAVDAIDNINDSADFTPVDTELDDVRQRALDAVEQIGQIAGAANGAAGDYDINFNVTVTGDPIPGGGFKRTTPVKEERIGFASGADFVVPPGYPNDSFGPLFVQSGERVQVTPAGQSSNGMNGGGQTIVVMIDGEEVAAKIEHRQGRRARIARSSGAALTGR